jgi:CubicO group peptidase (beta-lactamase class C family)
LTTSGPQAAPSFAWGRVERAFLAALPVLPARAHAAFICGVVDRTGLQHIASRGCEGDSPSFVFGSLTKLFLGTALAAWMEERPDITLQTPVAELCEAGWDERTTLAHLVTHRAGFDYSDQGIAMPAGPVGRDSSTHTGYVPPILRRPGSVPAYSNYGATCIARLLEQQDRVSLSTLLQRRVWAPMSLGSMRLIGDPASQAGLQLARDASGRPVPLMVMNPAYLGAGGVLGSAADALRFGSWLLRAAAGQGQPVLSARGAATLLDPLVSFGASGALEQALFFTRFTRDGQLVLGHTGSWPGHFALLQVFPQADIALFSAAVVPPDLPFSSDQMWGALVRAVLGPAAPAAQPRAEARPRPGSYVSSKLPLASAERALTLLGGRGITRVQRRGDVLSIGGQSPCLPSAEGNLTLAFEVSANIGLNDLVVAFGDCAGRPAMMRSGQREVHIRSAVATWLQPATHRLGLMAWLLLLSSPALGWSAQGAWSPFVPLLVALVAACALAVRSLGRLESASLQILQGNSSPLVHMHIAAALGLLALVGTCIVMLSGPGFDCLAGPVAALSCIHQGMVLMLCIIVTAVWVWLGLFGRWLTPR